MNEQTWTHIRKWERTLHGDCADIKLVRFRGRPDDLAPKAQLQRVLGYEKPFDRHDWTIDRCGLDVNYVIDFYRGDTTEETGDGHVKPSIHLDVRPKLDTFRNFIDRLVMSFHTMSLK